MNYQQFVISKTPTAYWTFNNFNETTAYGLTSTPYARGLKVSSYPYTQKAMGAGSKLVGTTGGGDFYNNSYVDIADAIINRAHVEAWIYIPSTASWNDNGFVFRFSPTLAYTNQTWMAINFNRNLNAISRDYDGAPTNTLVGTTVIPFDTWTYVAWQQTWNGTNYTKNLYINGNLEATVTTGDPIRTPRYCWTSDWAPAPLYVDEIAMWAGDTITLPTQAEMQQRAAFPMTKTKWWDSSTSSFIKSADELFWNGTAWVSMQDMPYKYWNGTSFVTL